MKRGTKLTAITVAITAAMTLAGPAFTASAGSRNRGDAVAAAPTEFGADITWIAPVVPPTTDTTDTTDKQAKASSNSEVLALHNDERKDKGVKALSMDATVERYAERHSKAMAEDGYLWHTKSLAKVLGNRNWTLAGENVGVGGSVEDVMKAFMDSPSHRRNILENRFDNAGVGVYRQELSSGSTLYWVTVVFYG